MITKIKKIKNFGVFDNYQTSADLPDFKKYNLIYGWNASGKTTLSRLLRCFELQAAHNEFLKAVFQLQTDNGIISNENLGQYSNIRVFNKDFIDDNVFTQENTIQPIYYLGKEDIEQKKQLEILKSEEKEKKAKLNSEKENLENKKKAKEKFIATEAKQIKQFLRTEGTDIYTNYNKLNFCENVESLNREEIDQSILSEEELNKKKKAINQAVKERIPLLEDQTLLNKEDIEKTNKILKTEVISETIEKLKNNKDINKWVKEGLDLYNNSNEGDCHFCEQPMPENRMEALKKHFSQDYQNLLTEIEKLKQEWESKKIEISIPNKSSLYDDLSSSLIETKRAIDLNPDPSLREQRIEARKEWEELKQDKKSLEKEIQNIKIQADRKYALYKNQYPDNKGLKTNAEKLYQKAEKLKEQKDEICKEIQDAKKKWDDLKSVEDELLKSAQITAQTVNKKLKSFQEEEENLKAEIKRYNQFISKILEQLEKKKENPFKNAEEIHYESFQIKDLIDEVNKIVSKHNRKTDSFEQARLKEKKDIEKHFLSESYQEYCALKNQIRDLEKFVKELTAEDFKIETKIEQLSQKRRDYKITAKTINEKLKLFLGREELIFEATNTEDEGYYIKRASNGKFAKSLSEGEKTAVALIYFLSKLNEENFDLNNGAVVIDDPISSLDSNSVFQAFGFIRSEVKKAKQIFILTHNFDFFKHIKHWFKRDCKEKAEFFMIKNFLAKQSKRTAKLSPLDDLLKDYDSEYQYLFSLLYGLKADEVNIPLKEIYPFPNIARKFMETFLFFKFPSEKNQDALFSTAKRKTSFNSGKIEKIKRFINTHSHSDIDKITSWDISQWSEGKQVIKDILELVKKLDEEHYKGLCKLAGR